MERGKIQTYIVSMMSEDGENIVAMVANISPCVCSDAQSCVTFCNPADCSRPGSSVHEILQARTLQQVAISSSRGASQHRKWTHTSCISCIGGRFFTTEPPEKPNIYTKDNQNSVSTSASHKTWLSAPT